MKQLMSVDKVKGIFIRGIATKQAEYSLDVDFLKQSNEMEVIYFCEELKLVRFHGFACKLS